MINQQQVDLSIELNQNYLENFTKIEIENQNCEYSSTLLKCLQNNQVVQFCVKQFCRQKNPFVCGDKKCECRKLHSFCQKGDIEQAFKAINKKIHKNDQIKIKIKDIVQKLIDQLSKFQDQLQSKFDKSMKFMQLSELQRNFLFFNTKKDFRYDFLGQNLCKMWDLFSLKPYNMKGAYFQTVQKIKALQLNITKILKQTSNQVDQITKTYKDNGFKIEQQFLSLNRDNKIIEYQFSQSFPANSILRDWKNIRSLIALFPKKIKRLQFKFKASEHKFNVKKYFQLCGTLSQTITITKNYKNKILGGFSNLQFKKDIYYYSRYDKNQLYGEQSDNSKSSFIFSLDQKVKFPLNDNYNNKDNKAIIRPQSKDKIAFMNIFQIYQLQKCKLSLNNQYYDTSKYPNESQSYLKLTGYTKQCEFDVKQWQVYQVQFEENK